MPEFAVCAGSIHFQHIKTSWTSRQIESWLVYVLFCPVLPLTLSEWHGRISWTSRQLWRKVLDWKLVGICPILSSFAFKIVWMTWQDKLALPPALKASAGLKASYTEMEACSDAVRQSQFGQMADSIWICKRRGFIISPCFLKTKNNFVHVKKYFLFCHMSCLTTWIGEMQGYSKWEKISLIEML